MSTLTTLKSHEPLALSSAITNAIKTVVLAFLAVAVGFGWVHWSEAQTALVVSLIAAFFVLLSAIFTTVTRTRVSPIEPGN